MPPDSLLPSATSEDGRGIIGEQAGSSYEDLVALAAIAAVFTFFAGYTWGRWGSLQIDCGREVYAPVEILKGRMLYRDVWYPYGPLAPYLQALLLWCFGIHLNTFYCFGLSLNLIVTCLAYSLARRLMPPSAAAVVSIVCVAQGFNESLFNYVFPYSYAAVVGLVLALVCLCFLFQYLDTQLDRKLFCAGLAMGLALLSKQEFGGAALIAIAFVIVWEFAEDRSFAALFHRGLMIAPGLLLAAVVYGWFLWRLTPDFMLRENFSLSPSSPFMKTIGPRWIERLGFRFEPREMLATFGRVVFSLTAWFLGARLLAGHIGRRWILPASACTLIILIISSHLWSIPFRLAQTAVFPVGMYWIAPFILIAAIVGLPRATDRATRGVVAVLAVFAMALASRVMFAVYRGGYSIYYDPPLFMLFMIAVVAVLWFGTASLSRPHRLYLMNCLLAMDAIFLLFPFPNHSDQRAPLETPIGKIYSSPAEAMLVPQMISFVRAQAAMGKRVLILPEFPMLYVMSGTESPSRWYGMVPGMLDSTDEAQLIAAAESQHVDYVIVTNRNTYEYEYPYFGIDWGKDTYRWIDSNFEQSGEFGKFERRRDAAFAALIYKRRTIPAPANARGAILNR